jgi:hypothetical protein
MTSNQVFGKVAHEGKQLIGRRALIVSDNDNYAKWRDKVLIITHASTYGNGYDNSVFPEMLCDFKCEDGNDFPCALYEYEFKLMK